MYSAINWHFKSSQDAYSWTQGINLSHTINYIKKNNLQCGKNPSRFANLHLLQLFNHFLLAMSSHRYTSLRTGRQDICCGRGDLKRMSGRRITHTHDLWNGANRGDKHPDSLLYCFDQQLFCINAFSISSTMREFCSLFPNLGSPDILKG